VAAARFVLLVASLATAQVPAQRPELNDVHFHLTNYIQQGTNIHEFLKIMGSKVGRVAIFGIPLQQEWSYRIDGNRAPTYYLNTDAPLYYYSFTDAWIATAYKSLTQDEQARFDPMITGFNPTDMYAVDHISRVLQTFPGVFSGIGEFTIHKEFVSGKIAGGVASLQDPALDRILDFAAEAGLIVLLHNDIDVPFPKEGSPPPTWRIREPSLGSTPIQPSSGLTWEWVASYAPSRIRPPSWQSCWKIRRSTTFISIFPGVKLLSTSWPAQTQFR